MTEKSSCGVCGEGRVVETIEKNHEVTIAKIDTIDMVGMLKTIAHPCYVDGARPNLHSGESGRRSM